MKVNKYAYKPDIVIDLHGLRAADAMELLCETLADAQHRYVRVITGKGIHSSGGEAVIKQQTISYLNSQSLSWRYAKLQDGGEGVVDVTMG